MKALQHGLLLLGLLLLSATSFAAADLEVNTPAIAAIKASMQARHSRLSPYYASGAVGQTRDGNVGVRDAGAVPLSERQTVNNLVAEENRDRGALYREIARANGHPEWESEVRSTFAQRWRDKAAPGWWVQNAAGAWVRK